MKWDSIVQYLSASYIYLFAVKTFDYVDCIFKIVALIFIYPECYSFFEDMGFSFYDYVTFQNLWL